MSRCGFLSVRYLEVKIRCKNTSDQGQCPLFGVRRWSLLGGRQCITSMGFSIRDQSFVRSRECVRFSECPLREVLLYIESSIPILVHHCTPALYSSAEELVVFILQTISISFPSSTLSMAYCLRLVHVCVQFSCNAGTNLVIAVLFQFHYQTQFSYSQISHSLQ